MHRLTPLVRPLAAPRARLFSRSAARRKDPWPLPHSPEHLASTATPADAPPPSPLPRPGERVETLRARLVYQSRKRGTLESDLLLSTFAKEQLPAMGEAELKEFDRLMDEPDWDIYYWATESRTPPERWAGSSLLEKLKVHARNEGKAVRRMPDLS
ncbi:succinate dehydrogenase assembly factor 2 [Phanerochaete sordida]|uniref:Succinate dehydrogenase assembly factor 2, mitochondrial n=1 Tax=Phanerochaete sordida TaxID=48140 RepID=A0A9P3LGZ5_9APHY|nr:succinate dehydrogenase assembly factor 2 [Phanerochaete sordida]